MGMRLTEFEMWIGLWQTTLPVGGILRKKKTQILTFFEVIVGPGLGSRGPHEHLAAVETKNRRTWNPMKSSVSPNRHLLCRLYRGQGTHRIGLPTACTLYRPSEQQVCVLLPAAQSYNSFTAPRNLTGLCATTSSTIAFSVVQTYLHY